MLFLFISIQLPEAEKPDNETQKDFHDSFMILHTLRINKVLWESLSASMQDFMVQVSGFYEAFITDF